MNTVKVCTVYGGWSSEILEKMLFVLIISDDVFVICRTPGKLSKFVQDLHSGKLHREFHHGPDPEQEPQQVVGTLFTICLSLCSFLVYPCPITFFILYLKKLKWIEITNFILFRIPLLTRLMITQEQKIIKVQKLKPRRGRQEEREADQEKRNKLHHQRQCSKNLLQVITDTPCSGMNCNR